MNHHKSLFLDGKRHEYAEELSVDDYFYDIDVIVNLKVCSVLISKGGVSICDPSGIIKTNLMPDSLFPNKNKLNPFDLARILTTLKNIGYEGKWFDIDDERWYKEDYE